MKFSLRLFLCSSFFYRKERKDFTQSSLSFFLIFQHNTKFAKLYLNKSVTEISDFYRDDKIVDYN